MTVQLSCPPAQTPLVCVIQHILHSGRISREDRQILNDVAWSEQPLSEEERSGIDEVWNRLQRGWLRIVD